MNVAGGKQKLRADPAQAQGILFRELLKRFCFLFLPLCLVCGSGSMSGIVEVYSLSSDESTGGPYASWVMCSQPSLPASLEFSECCAAVTQRTFTSGSDSAYLMYSPSES